MSVSILSVVCLVVCERVSVSVLSVCVVCVVCLVVCEREHAQCSVSGCV